MLSSWRRYWYIVELPFSLDNRDSQDHSWREGFILAESIGTQGSSTWCPFMGTSTEEQNRILEASMGSSHLVSTGMSGLLEGKQSLRGEAL